LLEVGFALHDPTTMNRQGNDRGTQYRSAVFMPLKQSSRLRWKSLPSLMPNGFGLTLS